MENKNEVYEEQKTSEKCQCPSIYIVQARLQEVNLEQKDQVPYDIIPKISRCILLAMAVILATIYLSTRLLRRNFRFKYD